MADLVVSQKVILVRSWTEDVVTDDVLNDIATHAKTDKGRKLKIKMNEAGIRLSRVRLLQATETKFIPIKIMQIVMQLQEFPKCVIIIVSDQEKKYKIIALRCASEAEAVKLTTAFAAIQNKVQSENIELTKQDNGNWSLRGRTDHNANQVFREMVNEHKQSNGDLRVVKTNGEVSHVPVIVVSERNRNVDHTEGVSVRHDKDVTKIHKKSDSDDDDDDYVIETEVTTQAYIPAKVHTDHEKAEMRNLTTRVENAAIENTTEDGWVMGKTHYDAKASAVLPSRPVVHKKLKSSTVVIPQPVVYETTSRSVAPSHPVVYASTSRNVELQHPVVYGTSSRNVEQPHHVVYGTSSRNVEQPHHVVYGTSSRSVVPSHTVVYPAASTRQVNLQPDGYSISSRAYQSPNPMITTSSAGYYTNPWAHRRVSRESSLVPFRVDGNPSAVKFDQQSMMSNTSKMSRYSRMRASETSIPMSVHRSIETVYPRPVLVLRESRGHGYRPRPASYHAHELRIFQAADHEAGYHL